MTNITFLTDDINAKALPKPGPASNFLPGWYRDMSSYIHNDKTSGKKIKKPYIQKDGQLAINYTLKKCPPLQDYLLTGYAIPLWTTLYIAYDDQKPSIQYNWPDRSLDLIEPHSFPQVQGSPFEQDSSETGFYKLKSPWHIKTPKGYSCLFLPAYYHQPLIEVLPAVVDTDTYHSVNFPFRFKGDAGFHTIDLGEPIVHVIPYKRESYKAVYDIIKEKDIAIELKKLWSVGHGLYQKYCRAKKKFM